MLTSIQGAVKESLTEEVTYQLSLKQQEKASCADIQAEGTAQIPLLQESLLLRDNNRSSASPYMYVRASMARLCFHTLSQHLHLSFRVLPQFLTAYVINIFFSFRV